MNNKRIAKPIVIHLTAPERRRIEARFKRENKGETGLSSWARNMLLEDWVSKFVKMGLLNPESDWVKKQMGVM